MSNERELANTLLGMMGSFWSELYAGRALLHSRFHGKVLLENEQYRFADDIANLANWHTAPLHQFRPWTLFKVRESEITRDNGTFWRYDTDSVTYDSGLASYSVPYGQTVRVRAPDGLVDCCMITGGIQASDITLHRGHDYYIQDGWLYLRENPTTRAFLTQDVYENGKITDRELFLWLFGANFDQNYVFDHFGYVLKHKNASTFAYRKFVGHALDAIARGTSADAFSRALAGVFGVNLIAEDGEQVEEIVRDTRNLLIITDKNVYKFHPRATSAVNVGDRLQKGDSAITDFHVHELRTGEVPQNLAALAVSPAMVNIPIKYDLLFENRDVPLTVTGTIDNERIYFPIGGHADDVEAFWAEVYTREATHKPAYACLRDFYGKVPATINPLAFLIKHILRYNTIIVRAASVGVHDALAVPYNVLRQIQPPHVLVIYVIGMPPKATLISDENIVDRAGDTTVATGTGRTVITDDNISVGNYDCKQLDFGCK